MVGEKQVYVLLTDTGTIFTRLIKSYTKKPYNHASIAFDADLEEVYSFGRKTARNPFIGGFVKEDMHSVLFRHADCAVYTLTVSNEEYQQMYQYIQRIAAIKEQYRYNIIGLFGVMLNMPIKRRNAFFCSQFVASVLKESNVINFNKALSLVQPNDIPEAADFQLMFEGKLKDYKRDRIQYALPIVSV